MSDLPKNTPENIAQTVQNLMATNSDVRVLSTMEQNGHALFDLPSGRKIENMTHQLRMLAEYDRPHRRTGVAKMQNLNSLIDWALRNHGEGSVLFADGTPKSASLTCIADYHLWGAPSINPMGEETARHCRHRAVYNFPLDKKWAKWIAVSGAPMTGPQMGEFLEDNILDVIDPPLALTLPNQAGAEATDAERRLIDIAARFNSNYGSAAQLFSMASSFAVHESAEFSLAHNTTTGEGRVVVTSEHKDASGQPINVPKLFLIALPVFEKGAVYRMPVRFQYRKSGGSVKFILTLHDPENAYDDAFSEACNLVRDQTGMPLFNGTPEQNN